MQRKVADVLADKEIDRDNYDVDHFISWSFVIQGRVLWDFGEKYETGVRVGETSGV